MGLFDKLFPKKTRNIPASETFSLLSGYTPVFSSWRGEMYESALVRAAIDAKARHFSKVRVRFEGSAKPELITRLKKRPNDFQTWSQLLYRICTILEMQNTCFIIPILGKYNEVTGITTMLPQMYELVEYNGEPWIRFTDFEGKTASIELWRIGILTKFQYKSDFFGSDNNALNDTLALIDIQSQGIKEAIKNSNTYRFWAKTNNLRMTSDLAEERKRFSRENFGKEGDSGLLLFPNTYSEVHQTSITPYEVDYNTMMLIQNNVFDYFGVNEAIIQNKADVEQLDSFYNGAIEPLIIQLEEVMTKMLFSINEQSYGNKVTVDSNRLMYMTTTQKVQLASLSNAGFFKIDEIRELFNYPPLPNGAGQVAPIRGEYKNVGELLIMPNEADTEPQTDETITGV